MTNESASTEDKHLRIQHAVENLLRALDVEVSGACAQTPERVAQLWSEHLLCAQHAQLGDLEITRSPAPAATPVSLVNIGVHLVCPHHLTVAFGKAHIAYEPGAYVTGFGSLTKILQHCTQRLVLQEDATRMVAECLAEKLEAKAVCVVIDATHPCHNVIHPRGHDARAITWAHSGDSILAAQLETRLQLEISAET